MARQFRFKKSGEGLGDKVDFLREVTALLLDEVKSLGSVKTLEIKNGINLEEELKSFEIRLIERALKEAGGSQTRAARILKLKKTTLNAKIKRFAIEFNKSRTDFGDA